MSEDLGRLGAKAPSRGSQTASEPSTVGRAPERAIPTTCVETIGGDPDTALRLSFQIKVF